MSVTVYIEMLVMKWVFFYFDIFINHVPKIHRSALHKTTIDPLSFWDVCEVNLWGKSFGKSTAYSRRTNAFV